MSTEFIEKLKAYTWKGNVRELKNIMERITILSDGPVLTPADLPFEIRNVSASYPSSFNLGEIEKYHIQKVLEHTKGNKTEAAHLLNIGLTTLYRKLEEYKLS